MDAILAGKIYDVDRVLGDILDELCALEEAGFYHTDIRIWNVILRDDGGASLIDFGALSTVNHDANWPDNALLSFWMFAWCTIERVARPGTPMLQPMMSPVHLPEPYRTWAMPFWRQPFSEWSFQKFRASFAEMRIVATPPLEQSPIELWMGAIESYLASLCDVMRARDEELALWMLQHSSQLPGLKK